MSNSCSAGVSLFCGSANPGLTEAVARRLGLPVGRLILRRFADGEVHVQIEESIRGRDVYIIQSTCPPVNENLMELLVMIDAFHRASAVRITTILPYYGYSRQEKKATGREPISAKLVANLLTAARADRVVSVDLHTPAIQGFFDIWMDHLSALSLLTEYLRSVRRSDAVVVSPDVGRVKLADKFSRALGLPLVVLHKRRPAPELAEIGLVIGDVKDKAPIIVDDMITTGRTINESVKALLDAGAKPEVRVAVTHALLLGPALDYLKNEAITEVIVTDSIPLPKEKRLDKIRVLTLADLLAETVRRLNRNESISALFGA
ncbi:MAG: ribose-phosphate pyrophosphokinase [Chloroflexi bacterium]|nr:ribose-phosphate pyrophosphokinase [Chloroflexota bacterium]